MVGSVPSSAPTHEPRTSPWGDGAQAEPVSAPHGHVVDSEQVEPGKGKSSRWRWVSRGIAALLLIFFLVIIWLALTAPLSKSLEPVAPPQMTLLAADGTAIARNGAIVDEPVEVSKLPPHVVDAFLSIEDRRFYDHWGIDPRGIGRAAWANLTGGSVQGGSTITQQLAKFTFLSSNRTLTRKAREALIAFWLEAWLTKDEILARYLSNAYFGDNVYGLRAASLHYFYRQPERLRPEQAAMLAGLVQAPSRYAPTRHYDRAEKRMRMVLAAMVDAGKLDAARAKAMPSPRLDVRRTKTLPTGTYFADWALPEARKRSEATYASVSMTTTLDSRLQAAAHRAISRAPLGKAQVALVAMRHNGEVVAMIGGRDYAKSPFNRATQAKRQPGSTFKLFVYLAALEAGWKPTDTIDNSEFTTGSYRPGNSGGRYSPSITLQDAFARSSNVAAVRLMNEIGSKGVVSMARQLGVTSPLPKGDPSMALGTSTMRLIELTAAYAGVAANSFPVRPSAFTVEEPGLFDRLMGKRGSLSGSDHAAIQAMLRRAVNSGTGRAAALSVPNYGKTGTSQDNRDALFVGYAGDLVVGVWVGNDDNTPLAGISGGGLPARIWRDFMNQALRKSGLPPPRRSQPSPNPQGPVQPLDVPDIGDIPIGNGTNLRVRDGEAVLSTDVEGFPVDVTVGPNGVRLDAEQLRRSAEERAGRVAERAQEEAERQREAAEQRREYLRDLEERRRESGTVE